VSVLGWVQLLADFFFLFMILVLLIGRSWRRGSAGGAGGEEQESYRAMVATLSEIIKAVKEATADMQDRMAEKQAEIQSSLVAADERLRRIKEENDRTESNLRRGPAVPVPAIPERPQDHSFPQSPRQALAEPKVPSIHAAKSAARDRSPIEEAPREGEASKEEERRAKYQQALEFMEKGWSALDIARFTQLPRGEVELLMRTKGKKI
jgi:hypothetical protein